MNEDGSVKVYALWRAGFSIGAASKNRRSSMVLFLPDVEA